jgi:hypothetical protein
MCMMDAPAVPETPEPPAPAPAPMPTQTPELSTRFGSAGVTNRRRAQGKSRYRVDTQASGKNAMSGTSGLQIPQ